MGCYVCEWAKRRFLKRHKERTHGNLLLEEAPEESTFDEYLTEDIFLGKGFLLEDHKRSKLVDIRQENGNRGNHTFVFGSSGVGKTKLIESTLCEDIVAGRNVVVIDPKGGADLYSRIVEAAYAAKREDDLMYLSPIFPDKSITIAPLSHYYMEEELINHVMAGVSTENEFFYAASLELSTFIIKTLLLVRKYLRCHESLTFREISKYVDYDNLNTLKKSLESIGTVEARHLILLGTTILGSGKEHFSKLTPTLRVALTEMTIGNTGKIIGNAKENNFMDRIENGKGVILYVQTGAMLTSKTAGTIARVLTSMIQSMVGRHDAAGIRLDRPLCYYGDEFSNIVYRGCEDLFNKGRSAGVMITALTQSMADIVAEIGEDRAVKLFDNTSTKIFMRVNDYGSARLIAMYGGIKKKHSPMLSLNGGITNREVEVDVLLPEHILRLEKREYFYFGFEGQYRGKTPKIGNPELKVTMPNTMKGRGEAFHI
ncbi:MAG TPA: TraM recognition domain-containing protein [Sulfuricurvum sp.]|nr:MAG: hypothetical protein B7Y30_09940 [Campylobacterales bacterium 16-40-21]OZA01997.1 MAG: hypothetical protein B7X89_11175 [Sulfuricurvum sp. 17-40-25]HQS67827.1 TraM recognition domain-containing protein [Sulfuricurvum sp.]HQT37235.1 TraM recognition domain-containing protein [Sulfuricurvum sp.]